MSIDPKAVAGFLGAVNPVYVVAAGALALIVLIIVVRTGRGLARTVRRGLSGKRPEDILTFIVAGLITAIAAQGMFRFFGDKLQMPWWMQSLTFCVFELAQVTCALRARRKIRDPKMGTAGIDGVLVWVMAGISAVLSATDAHGSGSVARMVFPFAAAVMWELGLAIERRRAGRSTIHWRWTPEKILVRFGLAEASDRTAGESDTHRRLVRVARAAKHLRDLKAAGASEKQIRRATRRLDAMNDAAAAHAGLATDPVVQEKLRSLVSVMFSATSLSEMAPESPWEDRPDRMTAVFDTARIQFAPLIAGALGTGTEKAAELDAGTGTEDAPDTGIGGTRVTGAGNPAKTGTRRRRRTGSRTGAKKGRGTDWETLLKRARELNDKHFREHGKHISGDKLAAGLRISKTRALPLLAEVKRLREVRSDDGVA
jgi:hypothetical protein